MPTTAIEKSWPAVAPQLLTADGTAQGVVTVANSAGFKVKQQIVVVATGLPSLTVKIMRFISPTQFYVGPITPTAGQGLTGRQNISAYTVAAGAYVYAETQPKVTIKPEDIWQAVYRQEPGTTIGVEIDDQWGNPINAENPLPVAFSGSISIGSVEIVDGDNTLNVNPDGSINVDITKGIGLFTLPYDTIGVTYPSATVENYQSYLGGLTGTPVQLVVVTYADSTKATLTSVVRTPSGP